MKSHNEVKILVVDDREDNLLSIESILEQDNYQITKANSGTAALKILLTKEDFTLILMDVKMPNLSGIETAELIYQRDKLKHIPIIFITAHNRDDERMFEGYRMGAVDFIYKPINPQLLRYKVSVFVDLFRKQNKLLEQDKLLRSINASLEQEVEERKASEQQVKLLNEQLLRSNQDLKIINEDLDRFAYVASHDLQEPLRKIIFFSDRINRRLAGQAGEEVDTCLQKILYSANRMQNLIRDILQFSRHDHQKNDFQFVDLNQVMNEILADMEEKVSQKQARIQVSTLPTVWGNATQLRQVFENLLSNSVKFGKKETPIEVKIHGKSINGSGHAVGHPEEPRRTYHEIYVEDNGIGFDMQHAEKIFEVFNRLHSYHVYEGTGIGLSICKKIVTKHQGSIKAFSTPNEGATFVITLPEAGVLV